MGRAGRYDQALNALDEALRLAPDSVAAQRARGVVQQNRALSGAQSLAFEPAAAEALGAGQAALGTDDPEAAEEAFDRAAEAQGEAQTDSAEGGVIAFYQGYARQLRNDLRGAVDATKRRSQGCRRALRSLTTQASPTSVGTARQGGRLPYAGRRRRS